jgi:hypothetical protein
MTSFKYAAAVTAVLALGATTIGAFAAKNQTKVGTLSCDVSAGTGFIIGSNKAIDCIFTSSTGGSREAYRGSIRKLGIDLGATTGGQMVWAVLAPTTLGHGALAGYYGGVNAEASVGVGGGANVLVGGSNRTIILQPLSVQSQTGINLAAGVADFELHPVR